MARTNQKMKNSNTILFSSLIYVILFIAYIAFSNGSPIWHKLYYAINYSIVAVAFLYIGSIQVFKGRKAFYYSISLFNFSVLLYNIIDWDLQFVMNYWLCLAFCIIALSTFLIGLLYDRKTAR